MFFIPIPPAKYSKEDAEIMIAKKRSIHPADLHPEIAQRYVKDGKNYWQLRDLINWNDPNFRHMILGLYKNYDKEVKNKDEVC